MYHPIFNQCQHGRGKIRTVAYGLTMYLCDIDQYHRVMANVKTTMTDIRVIIREFSRGTSLREMERKLKLSRTSLRAYRERAEASGKCMIDLLKLNDAELQAIMMKGDGHRGRDAERYAFMQENVEDYAKDMRRKYKVYGQSVRIHSVQGDNTGVREES